MTMLPWSRPYAAIYAAEKRRCTVCQMSCLLTAARARWRVARRVLEELQIDEILIVGVSKGPERRPGMEILHIPVAAIGSLIWMAASPALHSDSADS